MEDSHRSKSLSWSNRSYANFERILETAALRYDQFDLFDLFDLYDLPTLDDRSFPPFSTLPVYPASYVWSAGFETSSSGL